MSLPSFIKSISNILWNNSGNANYNKEHKYISSDNSTVIEGFANDEGLIGYIANTDHIITSSQTFFCNYDFTGVLLLVSNGGNGSSGCGKTLNGGGGGGGSYYDPSFNFIKDTTYTFIYNGTDATYSFSDNNGSIVTCQRGGSGDCAARGSGGGVNITGSIFSNLKARNGNQGGGGGGGANGNTSSSTNRNTLITINSKEFYVGGGGGGGGDFAAAYSGEYSKLSGIEGNNGTVQGKTSTTGYNSDIPGYSYGNGGGGGEGNDRHLGGGGSTGVLVIYYTASASRTIPSDPFTITGINYSDYINSNLTINYTVPDKTIANFNIINNTGSPAGGSIIIDNIIGGKVVTAIPQEFTFSSLYITDYIGDNSFQNGLYKCNHSSCSPGSPAYNMFSSKRLNGIDKLWISAYVDNGYDRYPYNSDGNYIGGTTVSQQKSTNIVSTGIINGEWVQIQLPYQLILKKYRIYPRMGIANWRERYPVKLYMVGSNDGITWHTVHIIDNISAPTNGNGVLEFTSSNNNDYSWFRLITNKVNATNGLLIHYGALTMTGVYVPPNSDSIIPTPVPMTGIYVNTNIITNLITGKTPWGIYDASLWDSSNQKLPEAMGNGRDATGSGSIGLSNSRDNGAAASIPYISGTTASGLIWPAGSIPTNFTVCSITRYTNTDSSKQRRILSSSIIYTADDFLHGHWERKRGVAYYAGWKTLDNVSIGTNLTDWLVMSGNNGTATPTNILADDVSRGNATGGVGGSILSINSNTSVEISDWGFTYLVIYDSVLTASEMSTVHNKLIYYLANGTMS